MDKTETTEASTSPNPRSSSLDSALKHMHSMSEKLELSRKECEELLVEGIMKASRAAEAGTEAILKAWQEWKLEQKAERAAVLVRRFLNVRTSDDKWDWDSTKGVVPEANLTAAGRELQKKIDQLNADLGQEHGTLGWFAGQGKGRQFMRTIGVLGTGFQANCLRKYVHDALDWAGFQPRIEEDGIQFSIFNLTFWRAQKAKQHKKSEAEKVKSIKNTARKRAVQTEVVSGSSSSI
jgi:hypothetical protein